jgi:hypothetical protein
MAEKCHTTGNGDHIQCRDVMWQRALWVHVSDHQQLKTWLCITGVIYANYNEELEDYEQITLWKIAQL